MPLESSPDHPQPLRVVAQAVKGWVERLGEVWVEGQVIEIRRRAGGTQYLTLRDPVADISVSLTTTSTVLDTAGPLSEGATVTALVKPAVWTSNGSLHYECRDLRPSGEGRLLAQLEQRKRMLHAEGLFDLARKKRLPVLPRAIGLVTAQGSAAERDVVENVRDRWPAAVVRTAYATMQGPAAVSQVIEALQRLDRDEAVDVIIVARGGGSLEDLLPFSDETLVRAVAAARTPVVSAIGHETDTPILDLVADLRASTPTDAAKRVVPNVADERDSLRQARHRLDHLLRTLVDQESHRLEQLRNRPVLAHPGGSLVVLTDQLSALRERAARAVAARLRDEQVGLDHARARVTALSPDATLRRGYAILLADGDRTVTSISDVAPGADLTARLADGTLVTTVREARHLPLLTTTEAP